jgi:hypothetical protein
LRGTIERWECSRGCGYYREWNEHPDYLNQTIIHPLLGRITAGDLLIRDITTHSCRQFWMAHRRSPKGRLEVAALSALSAGDREDVATNRQSRSLVVAGRRLRKDSYIPMPEVLRDSS